MIKLGENFEIDLERLISTRMLIQANSGGGKSYAIRKLLEESHGKVQQIVIDLEGEFATLREKYDYLLVGPGGDIQARIQTAELLAVKLLKLNVSTIIDLSELKHHERILFVKRFLDSLLGAPKDLWHPCLVIVDEAHQFCPEKSKSESGSSVIDLCTRGRKRGFCAVLATQRISKLNKDAAAECNNQMVGRTGLDIDQKRAADTLGITNKEEIRNLRNMADGEFQAFGPAIGRDVKKVKVGLTKTTHMDSKHIMAEPTPTPKNIMKIMKDVIDLPKEAETELKNLGDYKNKVVELKREIKKLGITQSKPLIKVDEKGLERAHQRGYREGVDEVMVEKHNMQKSYKQLEKKIIDIGKILGQEIMLPKLQHVEHRSVPKFTPKVTPSHPQSPSVTGRSMDIPRENLGNERLRSGAMKILGWLAGASPDSLTKQRIATLSGFSVKGGTFNTYISELKRSGWVVGSNELSITEEGLENAEAREIPSGEELLNLWKMKFRAGAGKILQFLYESYPNEVSKEEIGLETGFEASGGTFNTYLSELRRNGLIKINSGIKISEEFFE